MYQIFSGHDFAEFQKLCNFMSVNLDNSMMKHLKQKLIALLCVTFAVVSAWANDSVVWHHPVVGYTHSIVEVTKVVLHADRTEVSCHVHYPSGYWIQILGTAELQTDGRNFPVRDASGIPLGERYTMPESDEVDFTLTFDAVPLGTVKMNLVEPGGWTVYNIRPEDYRPEGIEDTYWRDVRTGDWFVGFSGDGVIYDGKVWDVVSRDERKDGRGQWVIAYGGEQLAVEVGKEKRGTRRITVGKEPAVECSLITGAALPDYPVEDLREGFKDNGYRADDSVTFVGWMKDMPAEAWEKGRSVEILRNNIFMDKQESFVAAMDSTGRFSVRVPLVNTSEIYIDIGRKGINTVVEPGETYFLLHDFSTGHVLFMGEDVRLQNELQTHPPLYVDGYLRKGQGTVDEFRIQMEEKYRHAVEGLSRRVEEHPNLSRRYRYYMESFVLTGLGCSMMQARFAVPGWQLPEDYVDFVRTKVWQRPPKPYTLCQTFSTLMRDYIDHSSEAKDKVRGDVTFNAFESLQQRGEISMTEEEVNAVEAYQLVVRDLQEKLNAEPSDSLRQRMVVEFGKSELSQRFMSLVTRFEDVLNEEILIDNIDFWKEDAESVGCDSILCQIHLARKLYGLIDNMRKPLPDRMMAKAEWGIRLEGGWDIVSREQEKYVSIQNRDLSDVSSLRSAEDVKDVTGGEALLRKLTEPYRGKLVLLDIWGTWCGPCKEALSHSHELFERMRPYGVVFLYLANRSAEDSWKNVIKQYNVVGDNVVHYNLPDDQQRAIEQYLGVNCFPSYRLIGVDGHVLDVNADPRNLDALEGLVKQLVLSGQ
ncbi:TlpA family protein disulfide reductase [Paraprevotella xylaniphila]|uniref:TlpA family protein disulfide reductase n=1 Tax=Paraprevotella xylaniphila TaxID=454155 RepID=UPI0039F51345